LAQDTLDWSSPFQFVCQSHGAEPDARMSQEERTNVVYATLPWESDFSTAVEAMRQYGEISSFDLIDVSQGLLKVKYYDVRSAAKALRGLGDIYCWQATPCGERTVTLPGTVSLGKDILSKICDVRADDSDHAKYIIEFCDIRDAANYRKLTAEDEEVAAAAAAEDSSAWSTIASERLVVTGLPNELLTDIMMEAILEQAGLRSEVWSYSMESGRQGLGSATLVMCGHGSAERGLHHFKNCTWGCHATLLGGAASESSGRAYEDFEDVDGILLQRMEAREDRESGNDWANEETFGTAASRGGCWSYADQVAANAKLQEWPAYSGISKEQPPGSEASTEISEDNWWKGSPEHVAQYLSVA